MGEDLLLQLQEWMADNPNRESLSVTDALLLAVLNEVRELNHQVALQNKPKPPHFAY